MSYIYMITNEVNNKKYVGQTSLTLQERFKIHLRDAYKDLPNRPLYNAMKKYGKENFSISLIEECPFNVVNEREIYWIDKLNTYKDGYNATLGGEGQPLYNYEDISNKYLELKTVQATADFFSCDRETVRRACQKYDIITDFPRGAESQSKQVAQIDKESDEIIAVYDSISEAARQLGSLSYNKHISEVCCGKRKTAYGYKWKHL